MTSTEDVVRRGQAASVAVRGMERAELVGATLDDLARAGAQRMIAAALEIEAA